jgi:ABC-type bacteriocin/lantibiotic exporter with double-glycine peptidase domain
MARRSGDAGAAILRDIALASLTISILTIFPPILVMTMVNKVMQFHSVSTLVLISAIMVVVWVYETLLGYARRLIIAVVGARLDTKLNLHLFSRLLRLHSIISSAIRPARRCIGSLRSTGCGSF